MKKTTVFLIISMCALVATAQTAKPLLKVQAKYEQANVKVKNLDNLASGIKTMNCMEHSGSALVIFPFVDNTSLFIIMNMIKKAEFNRECIKVLDEINNQSMEEYLIIDKPLLNSEKELIDEYEGPSIA